MSDKKRIKRKKYDWIELKYIYIYIYICKSRIKSTKRTRSVLLCSILDDGKGKKKRKKKRIPS